MQQTLSLTQGVHPNQAVVPSHHAGLTSFAGLLGKPWLSIAAPTE